MFNEKRICKRTAITMATVAASAVSCFADGLGSDGFYEVVEPIVDLLNAMIGPALVIVGAVGSLYCILLGVKYARAEEPQDREKAKAHLKGAIIGFVLIFILIVALDLAMPILTKWASGYQQDITKY